MPNRNMNSVIANCSFILVVLIISALISLNALIPDKPIGEVSFVWLIIFVIILSLLLINALCCLRPSCAGWWGILKGFISFTFLAISGPGIGRCLEFALDRSPIRLNIIAITYHFVTLLVIVLPIIGAIRKIKRSKRKLEEASYERNK